MKFYQFRVGCKIIEYNSWDILVNSEILVCITQYKGFSGSEDRDCVRI